MRDRDKMYDVLVEYLGYEEAFNALWQALSGDEQEENFDWIARMYDLPDVEE